MKKLTVSGKVAMTKRVEDQWCSILFKTTLFGLDYVQSSGCSKSSFAEPSY